MSKLVSRCLVAVVLALSVAGCGDSGESSTSTTVATDIGDAVTVTSAAPTSSTTADTQPTALVGVIDPHDAAKRLYDAWKAGDRATAETVAEPAAVEGMWATEPGDYALYNKCNTGEFGGSACLYRGNPGTIQFKMEQLDAMWVVRFAIFSPA